MQTVRTHALPESPDSGAVYILLPQEESLSLYPERTDRNIGWITPEEQQMLRSLTVGIAGCGGMGGLVASTLLRLGIGHIKIADNEIFDVSNLNRQFAANKGTLGKSKAFETAKMLRQITDDSAISVYPMGINEESVADFVSGCDVICDEIEFWALGSRMLLHAHAREQKIPLFNSPTVGHRVYVYLYTHDSMTIEKVVGMTYEEAKLLQSKIAQRSATPDQIRHLMEVMLRFAAPEIPEYTAKESSYSTVKALRDRLFEQTTASIIATNPPMASGMLANQVLFKLLEKSGIERCFVKVIPMPGYLMFDAGLMECKVCDAVWW